LPFATGAGQPDDGLHEPPVWHWSAVHITVLPLPHTPLWQVSPVVQALLSLHVTPFATATGAGQPVAGTHAPTV
jgi:hypothetical protein